MLDDLLAVDWSSLTHPLYGPAEQVPDQLRGLLDPDPTTRQECFHALFAYLLGPQHQLAPGPALAVVPFLLQIAGTEEAGRGYAALLLCAIARAARMTRNEAIRDVLETSREIIRAWSGPALVDARAYLLSCLDRFSTPEERPERKVLRALWRALSEDGPS
jgi:hypothetical protein